MVALISFFTLLYTLFTFWLWLYWQKIAVFKPIFHQKTPEKVSVIIPVRNEAQHIASLLKDIEQQCWPDDSPFSSQQLEVIVVDDHSEDGSGMLVKAYHSKTFTLRLIALALPKYFKGSHKKLAISQAIDIAEGDIIITTDGDCRVSPQWVATVIQYMKITNAVMVSAPVALEGKSFFEQLQVIEFASLIGTGAACMEAGRPNMCNGANLAFTKSAFEAVNGYEGSLHIPSGDDEFLLQKLHKRYPGQTFFLKCKEAVVLTLAHQSLRGFYYQRKRWAGKWKMHKNIITALLALFIFSFHALLITGGILSLTGLFPWKWMLLLLSIKGLTEFLFLRDVLHAMNKKLSVVNFLWLQLIYSPYAVFFGIVANFGGYQWKERQYP